MKVPISLMGKHMVAEVLVKDKGGVVGIHIRVGGIEMACAALTSAEARELGNQLDCASIRASVA